MLEAGLRQIVADREAGLAAADDDDRDMGPGGCLMLRFNHAILAE